MAKRRKYRYPSREAAEHAVTQADQATILAYRALCSALDGSLEWLAQRNAGYRVGMYDHQSVGGPKVILEWHPSSDQKPHYQLYDAYEFPPVMDASTRDAGQDPLRLSLRECAQFVRERLRALEREWAAQRAVA